MVSQTLYLYSSSVHILLNKSGICDVTAAVICLRNLGKVTASQSMYTACTLHHYLPPPKKSTEILGQVNKTAMCYTNPTNPIHCKLVVWRTPHFIVEV